MDFQLVDSGWDRILDESLRTDHARIRIVCPFIKERAARRLLKHGVPEQFQVITRFDLDGFLEGASDISALRLLYDAGAQIRGVRNLHAKEYLIGPRAIVTSANLTEQALSRNHEFGFTTSDASIVANCHDYFESLWTRAGTNLWASKLDKWEQMVTLALASGSSNRGSSQLGDEGAEAGFAAQAATQPNWVTTAEQGFVKFFGEGTNRLEPSFPALEEVKRAGCHWACSYPKKPRQPKDGAIMFMGRLVRRPNDILIFGRAIGMHYVEGRDDASEDDLIERDWKKDWPHYIRVHNPQFINGTLGDGVSLNELMSELGSNAFATTRRHALEGMGGNTNPRAAIMQQPHVELAPEGFAWVNLRLQEAFDRNGKLSPAVLAELDWPDVVL